MSKRKVARKRRDRRGTGSDPKELTTDN